MRELLKTKRKKKVLSESHSSQKKTNVNFIGSSWKGKFNGGDFFSLTMLEKIDETFDFLKKFILFLFLK
jgi:hypothetical protein